MKQCSAFTLIEIIIVIVILGLLAGLALPRIIGQMESSKSAEVVNMFGALRRAAVSCSDVTNNGTHCVLWAQLGMSTPVSAKFSYTSSYTAPNILFNARSNAGASAGQDICMQIDATNSSMTYSFNGSYFESIVTRMGTLGGFTCAPANPM